MEAQVSAGLFDYKQVKSEDESPLETVWSEEHECVPLKQRLKMLRAKAVLKNRNEIPSPVNDVVNKEDEDFNEDFDHVSLKQRQRMLLSRERVRSNRPAMEYHNSSDPSTNPSSEALKHGSSKGTTAGAPTWTYQHENTSVSKSPNFKNVCNEARQCSSSKKHLLSSPCKDDCTTALKPFPNVKVEPLDGDFEFPNCSIGNQISVKSEAVSSSESLEDVLDHMMLGDRMRLLASRKFSKTNVYGSFETGNAHKSKLSKSSKPFVIKRPRKRRITATDSVETALEEDAPGLLKVLIAKGVLVDEIKLYGANEDDEALDESLIEESFSDLEDVITKIFSQQQSFLKFAPLRCGGRGEKTSYCLACLISLVEQARYLRVRKWPVEWGWCRDLQSFIFVFNKHNRIVLERPEYGYATYFFELVDALPVHWQIKRLITAMKLTSCTRLTLIENRALTVGDDLTEGEARVLMEYGWIPNTGLGTMLNYCDRVVHDRKSEIESDGSEWRSKIGKILTDGYNGGIIVPNDIPKRVIEYGLSHTPEIKLEY
ncbi:hypothetical protein HanRHA438_Chr15g0711771 [Helianthus annuus]|uniref:Uncharacterized protein n=1 Tax=Helianthus annuus TaxID=4232 RepID=A0A9K3E121_HELAN|nr:hypothetical protein HanXRQr2_Chr15g0699501 [Helianthus annuus]KAJ0451659.1 hypothetical protein HanHA300_Chr15g0570101 [Helianthus annuus]KAJ0456283.1 hypothetical protein HanIR_Chr15g0760651 [Helianthus annuus]KAJ0473542.1 hypothetical protein HanHA89_Chr15g0619541 [Helianthus annuus]KAJ0649121.1 hypothetical protein HanLR1_Chr15g0580661 [Helianthus annuus]